MLQRYNIPHAPIPETSRIVMNLRVIATYCELYPLISSIISSTDFFFSTVFFLSTDYHRFPQIIFWHGNPRLFQRHGLATHWHIHGTSWLRLASQVHGLVCSAETSRVYTFSIALMQIKPLSIAQLAVPFSKPCPSVPKKFLIGFPSGRRTSFPNSHALFPHVPDYSLQRPRFWAST